MLFVGPNDLASSMGYFAFDHGQIAEVQHASQRVLDAAKSAGKYAGHFALSAKIGTVSFSGDVLYSSSVTDHLYSVREI